MKKAPKKLTPVDLAQCQGEHQVGAFTCGGRIGERTRCTNSPSYVAKEKKPNPKDGLRGSMSLCRTCKEVCERQMPSACTYTFIKKS